MELISKDALEAKLMLCMDINRADWSYNKMIMANKMLEILDQEPIIEERKHGHWIFTFIFIVALRRFSILTINQRCTKKS